MGENLGSDVSAPEEIEMFVVGDFGGDGGGRELTEHGADIDERVGAAVEEDNGGSDVASRVFRDLREAGRGGAGQGKWEGGVVVVHLEGLGADDLEPVHDGFGGGEGVEMRVGGEFLRGGDIGGAPIEQEADTGVDDFNIKRWVDDAFP